MNKIIRCCTLCTLGLFFIAMPLMLMGSIAHAAYNPLEIINIKPAGTGTPAISPNHRIFRAYPGLEYNVRAAVIGGMYPYKFSLSNAPSGMVIDENTGVIRWPNPQASAQTIRLTVKDSEGQTISSTWSINVTTRGFIFVDASYRGTEAGTLSQPYNSVQDLLNLSGRESDIVYFRGGTYPVPIFHSDYGPGYGCSLSYAGGKPHIWIGYPGESVIIDMDQHYFCTGHETTPYYFGNLRFYNFYEYGFAASSRSNYATFYRCEFDTLTTGRTVNGNQGFYFTFAEGTGNYLVFQDCEFHDYTGTSGIGSLYCQNKILIEGCRFYNQYMGGSYICTAIAAKSSITNSTIRANKAVISEGSVLGAGMNGAFTRTEGYSFSDNNEICFNYFVNNSGGLVHKFNNNGNQLSTYYYRNTCVGGISMNYINADGYTNGPFIFDKNVIINNESGLSYHYTCGSNPQNYVTFTNNLTGLPSSGIIDSNGNLTNNYSQYTGFRGWQTGDEEGSSDISDNIPPRAPSGVSTIIYD